jgi:hypothetical protein
MVVFTFMENWKTIKDFNNYEVSSFGNVRRKKCQVIYCNGIITNYKEKLLKQEINREKYNRVTLSQNNIKKRYQTHRLVAEYFLENPFNKPCVNHIDGDGLNNNVSNLEWCTYSENEKHSYSVLGKINSNRKLNKDQVNDIINNCIKSNTNNVILFPGNVRKFMLKYNVSRNTILNILNKKQYVSIT